MTPDSRWLMRLLSIPLTIIAMLMIWTMGCDLIRSGMLAPGEQLPEISAAEWVGGDPISNADLEGKVAVIDCWAPWCGPCRAVMPHLVDLHRKFADQGVVFLGLTSDGPDDRREVDDAMTSANVSWPTGLGASRTMNSLRVSGIPAIFVVGKDGRIVWHNGLGGKLEDAVQQALNQVSS